MIIENNVVYAHIYVKKKTCEICDEVFLLISISLKIINNAFVYFQYSNS